MVGASVYFVYSPCPAWVLQSQYHLIWHRRKAGIYNKWMNEWRVLRGWRNWKAVRVGFRTIVHTTGLQVCSSDSSSSATAICNMPFFLLPRFEAAQTWQLAHVSKYCPANLHKCTVWLPVPFFFLTREFPWIVIYFYCILMSYILFSKTDTLEYISYHKKKSTQIRNQITSS